MQQVVSSVWGWAKQHGHLMLWGLNFHLFPHCMRGRSCQEHTEPRFEGRWPSQGEMFWAQLEGLGTSASTAGETRHAQGVQWSPLNRGGSLLPFALLHNLSLSALLLFSPLEDGQRSIFVPSFYSSC